MVYSDIWDDIILATILDPSKKSFHFASEPAASIFQTERTQNVIVDQQTEIELAEGEEDNDRIRMQLKNATHQRFWRPNGKDSKCNCRSTN